MIEGLITEIAGPVAVLRLNRPEARNAISSDILQAMLRFVESIEHDPAVRVLSISGAGEHFMAGGDVKGFAAMLDLPAEERRADFERRSREAAPLWLALERIPQPVVCSVRGFAAGMALSFVAGSDYCVASETAQFVLAHVGIGLVADAATTYHLPRAIGIRKAKEMAYLGGRYDARQALDMGLVNTIVADAELEAETDRIVQEFAAGPATSLAWAKRLTNASFAQSLEQQLALEGKAVGECGASEEVSEGVRAFFEKRKPDFGRI